MERELLGIWNFILFKVIESLQQYCKISNILLSQEQETEACGKVGNFPKATQLILKGAGIRGEVFPTPMLIPWYYLIMQSPILEDGEERCGRSEIISKPT